MTHQFHEGERAMQRRAGVADTADRVSGSIHAEIPPRAQAFLAEQPFAVLASRDLAGRVWASVVYGAPGFLHVPSAGLLEIDAAPVAGDPLAQNLAIGAPIGALVIDLATRRRMRVNGRIERVSSPIRVAVDECFANCPKYIQQRELVTEGRAVAPASTPLQATALSIGQQLRIARADTFFIASGHGATGLDASHRGGAFGFVQVLDERHIAWPDYAGNSMFQTLGNLASDSHAGIAFVDFATGDLLQLSGRARVDFDPARAALFAGAERTVDFEIDAVCEIAAAVPLRSYEVEASPFNPS